MKLPHHSTVVAYVALFAALGGGAYAAVKLPKNSVGNAQLKKNAVTSTKVKDHSLKAVDFAKGQLKAGPQGPAGPKGDTGLPGATGAKGDKGDTGAPGSALAYVHLTYTGTIDSAASKNIAAVNKPSATQGIYCLKVSVPFVNVVATEENQAGVGAASVNLSPDGYCADLPGANVEVYTYSYTGAFSNTGFYAIFN